MGAAFWIKRYVMAALPLFAILAGVEWFKGSATGRDYASAAAWALAAAALFTLSSWRRYRNAAACTMCEDLTAARKASAAGKTKKAP